MFLVKGKKVVGGSGGGGRGGELGGKCNRYLGILQKLALAQPRLLVIMIATKVCCVLLGHTPCCSTD